MLLEECTEGVIRLNTFDDIPDTEALWAKRDGHVYEINELLIYLNKSGARVFLAPERFFMAEVRGLYHAKTNALFINELYAYNMLAIVRHEGMHAAQDCMAGSINNTFLAVINPEEDVPMLFQALVERVYPPNARPWEAEATWAAAVPGMTLDALKACAGPEPMWKTYEPTPMTREWLEAEGWLK